MFYGGKFYSKQERGIRSVWSDGRGALNIVQVRYILEAVLL